MTSSTPAAALDSAGHEDFNQRGFMSPTEMMSPNLADRLDTEVHHLLDRLGHDQDLARVHVTARETFRGAARPRRVNALWALSPTFHDLLSDPLITACSATALRGRPHVWISQQLLVKWPTPTSVNRWHRDPGAPLGQDASSDFVIGVHLDSAPPGSSLRVVPGSHHWSASRAHRWIEHLPAQGSGPGAVEVPIQARGLTVHSRALVHGSSAQAPPGPRRSIYIHYLPLTLARRTLGAELAERRWAAHRGFLGAGS